MVNSRHTLFIDIIAAVLILLFVYTAVSKLFDQQLFRTALEKSPLISNKAGIAAFGIPAAELLVSVLLFLPGTRIWGLYGSFILMSVFSLYLGYMILFERDLPCSCGGVLKRLKWNQHLVFNIFFLAFSFTGIMMHRRHFRKENKGELAPVVYT